MVIGLGQEKEFYLAVIVAGRGGGEGYGRHEELAIFEFYFSKSKTLR